MRRYKWTVRSYSYGGGRLNKSDMILLLLRSNNAEPIYGKTRLVKMMYIIDRKLESMNLKTNYNFKAHYYGPYSSGLVEDLEKLVKNGLMDCQTLKKGVLTYVYSITQRGLTIINEFIKKSEAKPYLKMVEDVKREYGELPLFTLIDEVYRKYPLPQD